MLLAYQQTIVNAFQEVSNSLIAYQKGREFSEQQELLTTAAQGHNYFLKREERSCTQHLFWRHS
jgi:outer membrane protein TolC